MSTAVENHVIDSIAKAPMRSHPYSHIYVENVFPPAFYALLRRNWPDAEHFVNLSSMSRVKKGIYERRFIMPLQPEAIAALPEEKRAFWTEVGAWMLAGRFLNEVLGKFEDCARDRFGPALEDVSFRPEVLVVRDHTDYKLGPHTDRPDKVLSVLFYCPDDDSMRHLGTSIYQPLDAGFSCPGGPHYSHHLFSKVTTMEYRPNTLFAFFKTDTSFHGVDPIRDGDVLRDLMLYDIQVAAPAHRQE